MAHRLGDDTAAFLKVAATISGNLVGWMYGGPIGGLLLSSTLVAAVETFKSTHKEGLKIRWQNFCETLNPFNTTCSGKGGAYTEALSHLSIIFAWGITFMGTGYFAPAFAPYFSNWIPKAAQALSVELTCSQVVGRIAGALLDQGNSVWQERLAAERFERESASLSLA